VFMPDIQPNSWTLLLGPDYRLLSLTVAHTQVSSHLSTCPHCVHPTAPTATLLHCYTVMWLWLWVTVTVGDCDCGWLWLTYILYIVLTVSTINNKLGNKFSITACTHETRHDSSCLPRVAKGCTPMCVHLYICEYVCLYMYVCTCVCVCVCVWCFPVIARHTEWERGKQYSNYWHTPHIYINNFQINLNLNFNIIYKCM
jgi:hypothetical protein